jgi:hypothetical protein
MTANGVESYLLVFGDCKSGDRNGRPHSYVCRGLRDCGVPDVADLAMLFVGGVLMPVPSCLHGKQAHAKHKGHGQQSYGYSLGRGETLAPPPNMIPLMRLRP